MASQQPTPFHELLKEHRSTLGLTQKELAAALHRTERTISAYERGARLPPKAMLPLLFTVLRLTQPGCAEMETAWFRAHRTYGQKLKKQRRRRHAPKPRVPHDRDHGSVSEFPPIEDALDQAVGDLPAELDGSTDARGGSLGEVALEPVSVGPATGRVAEDMDMAQADVVASGRPPDKPTPPPQASTLFTVAEAPADTIAPESAVRRDVRATVFARRALVWMLVALLAGITIGAVLIAPLWQALHPSLTVAGHRHIQRQHTRPPSHRTPLAMVQVQRVGPCLWHATLTVTGLRPYAPVEVSNDYDRHDCVTGRVSQLYWGPATFPPANGRGVWQVTLIQGDFGTYHYVFSSAGTTTAITFSYGRHLVRMPEQSRSTTQTAV